LRLRVRSRLRGTLNSGVYYEHKEKPNPKPKLAVVRDKDTSAMH
jgi:hypothetical protein